jgi:hypothetical protein
MSRHVLALLVCIVVGAPTLLAQRPITLGVAGGVSVPTGDLSDGVQTGWHALGTLAVSTPKQPLGLRIDGAYHQFDFANDGPIRVDAGAQTIVSGTANVTYRLPTPNSPLAPYVITGLGAYRTACTEESVCDAKTRFGWNAGLGTKWYFRRVTGFLEARFHRTTRAGDGVPWVPVTFGVLL